MHDELEEAAKELKKKQKKELEKLKNENLDQFAIKGSESEWGKVLSGKGKKQLISIKSGEKRLHEETNDETKDDVLPIKKKKNIKTREIKRCRVIETCFIMIVLRLFVNNKLNCSKLLVRIFLYI
nr:unnamed protein product [Callosobruchus chinensis]